MVVEIVKVGATIEPQADTRMSEEPLQATVTVEFSVEEHFNLTSKSYGNRLVNLYHIYSHYPTRNKGALQSYEFISSSKS